LLLFLLVIALGMETLRTLSRVNDASAQIRDRWLPGTYALEDLKNFTTDFPAAATALRRAQEAGGRLVTERQMADLDRRIAAAQEAYRRLPHDAEELELYRRFEAQWHAYRQVPAQSDASKPAYAAAGATLEALSTRNIRGAREASERPDLVYDQARRRLTMTLLLAGILVAGAMIHVTRSISGPLIALAARMHRLAAGEIDIEVGSTERHDEIGETARAVLVFRDNAIDLAQNQQALAQQAAMLRRKLAEEKRLTLLQRNFVSMASHEFRTPLAIIDGHAQRLISMRDRLTGNELDERARKVRSVVRRMTQLIDNLIGSARLIDGPIDQYYQPTQFDLRPLLREVCQLQRELTPEATILESIGSEPLYVFGDAGLLSQVVANLLSNAVKYSPEGGLIQLNTARVGAELAVTVADQGIGIYEKDRSRVFEPYFRGSNTSGIVGSGVGLHLVRTIADLHHGSVTLDSREDAGSSFTLRLPIRSAGALLAAVNAR
jgi:signal transduction histidine kinase